LTSVTDTSVQAFSAVAKTSFNQAHRELVDIISDYAELTNMPRTGTLDNYAHPTQQLNTSPAVEDNDGTFPHLPVGESHTKF
jgi:hypothetical protein